MLLKLFCLWKVVSVSGRAAVSISTHHCVWIPAVQRTATDDALPLVLSHIWNSVTASRNLILESYYSCSPLVIASCRSQMKMGKRLHSNFCPLANCNKDLNIHIQQRQLVCESQIDTWPRPHTDVFVWLLPLTHPWQVCVSSVIIALFHNNPLYSHLQQSPLWWTWFEFSRLSFLSCHDSHKRARGVWTWFVDLWRDGESTFSLLWALDGPFTVFHEDVEFKEIKVAMKMWLPEFNPFKCSNNHHSTDALYHNFKQCEFSPIFDVIFTIGPLSFSCPPRGVWV